jgi:hypothetical protein
VGGWAVVCAVVAPPPPPQPAAASAAAPIPIAASLCPMRCMALAPFAVVGASSPIRSAAMAGSATGGSAAGPGYIAGAIDPGGEMDESRARHVEAGALIVVFGATLLAVSLFLPWFDEGISAWTVFEALDLLLAAIAVAALLAASTRFGAPEVVPTRALPYLGAVALVVAAATLLNHPPVAIGRPVDVGLWLAVVGAVVLAAGAVLSEFGVSLSIRFERRAGAVGGPAVAPSSPSPAPAPPPAPIGPEDDTVRKPPDQAP